MSLFLPKVSACPADVQQEQNEEQLQTESHEITEPPKHPEYTLESDRLSSFRTWGVQRPDILSKAGFYYTGIKYSSEKGQNDHLKMIQKMKLLSTNYFNFQERRTLFDVSTVMEVCVTGTMRTTPSLSMRDGIRTAPSSKASKVNWNNI